MQNLRWIETNARVQSPQEPVGAAAAEPMSIANEAWGDFFADLSRTHLGVPVTVHVHPRDGEQQELAKEVPLVGIALEKQEADCQVEIILGDNPDSYMRHTMHQVANVRVYPGEGERESLLQIESPGEISELRWREP